MDCMCQPDVWPLFNIFAQNAVWVCYVFIINFGGVVDIVALKLLHDCRCALLHGLKLRRRLHIINRDNWVQNSCR